MEDQGDKLRARALERLKGDLVEEMGLGKAVENQGWGELTAKVCGSIGGKMSSKLSPNLLRKLAQGEKQSNPPK